MTDERADGGPTETARSSADDRASTAARGWPDAVWIAWLIAAAVLVLLTVNVVRHLTARTGAHGMHMPAGEAFFRAGGAPLGPLLSHHLVTAWHVDAVALAFVVLLAAWYLTALARRTRRRPDAPWPLARIASFAAGLAVCVFATNGSIAVYDMSLFSAHMLGHLALVMLAPALLVAGRPLRLAVESSRESTARRIERIAQGRTVSLLTSPPVALASYTAVIVGSHLTGLMDTIMRNTVAGQVEHLVYLVVGYQFFVLVVGDEPIRWRLVDAGPVGPARDLHGRRHVHRGHADDGDGADRHVTTGRVGGRSARRHPYRRFDHVVRRRPDHGGGDDAAGLRLATQRRPVAARS